MSTISMTYVFSSRSPYPKHYILWSAPRQRPAELRAGQRPGSLSAARLGVWPWGNSPVFRALGTGRGGYSRFPTPHVQNAIVRGHIAIFTKSILYSKYYTFQE